MLRVFNEAYDERKQHEEKCSALLAGCIGLCGGGCGALGTAVWLMTTDKGLDAKMEFKNPKAMEMIEKAFLPNTDYEFECSDIIGRKFEDIEDHANFINVGGCSMLIKALAPEKSLLNNYIFFDPIINLILS